MSNDSASVSGADDEEQEPKLRTPLMTALEKGDLDEVRQLLSSGADLNSPGPKITLSRLQPQVPSYPLIWAVDVDDPEVGRLLLDNGADPNIRCEYMDESRACWLRPLCHTHHLGIVAMLLDAGAEVNAQQRSVTGTETALLNAASRLPSVGEILIERGADVNVTNEVGCGALYRAILHKHHQLAARLVQAGAEVDQCPPSNMITPLMLAFVNKSSNSTIQLLLQSGANPHLSDVSGRTVLSWAVRNRNVWAIKCLIAENVDVEMPVGGPDERKPAFQFLFDKCRTALQWGYADFDRCLEYLRAMQALALAGANIEANSQIASVTQAQLTEDLNSVVSRTIAISKAPSVETYETMADDLQEISDIVHVLTDMLSNPLSLKHLCRVQIRRSLGRDFRQKLQQLNIPLQIQEYLVIYKENDTRI